MVPGIFNPSSNEVVIAVIGHGTDAGPHIPLSGEGEGSADLVVHETAHGLDMGGGSPFLSASQTFNAARNLRLNLVTQYEMQPGEAGQQETFAESAARFFTSQDDAMPQLHLYWTNIASELAAHSPASGPFHFPFFSSIGSASIASDGTTIRMRLAQLLRMVLLATDYLWFQIAIPSGSRLRITSRISTRRETRREV